MKRLKKELVNKNPRVNGDFFYYNTSRFWNNTLDATSNTAKYATTSNNEVVNVNSVNGGSTPPLTNLLLSYTLKFKCENTTNFATPLANIISTIVIALCKKNKNNEIINGNTEFLNTLAKQNERVAKKNGEST